MTQDELKLVLDALMFCHGGEPCGTAEAIVVVEKALAQPEQEPVAEIVSNVNGFLSTQWSEKWSPNLGDKLYTTPPQRTWVGLTEENVRKICGSVPSMREAVREAEAILKECNDHSI